MSYLLAPSELVICEDAQKYGTTQERLCKHLILEHGYDRHEWILGGRSQIEIENMHNQEHKNKCSHKHAKKVVILGYEPKIAKKVEKALTWLEYNADCFGRKF